MSRFFTIRMIRNLSCIYLRYANQLDWHITIMNQWKLPALAFKANVVWYLLFVFDISSKNTSVVKINQVILYRWNLGESWNNEPKWSGSEVYPSLCPITPGSFYRINRVKTKPTFWLNCPCNIVIIYAYVMILIKIILHE